MNSAFALSIYTAGSEEGEIALPVGATRYFTADDPVRTLRDTKVPAAPLGHFSVRGDKLWIQVQKTAKPGTVRINGVSFTGTTQIVHGDEIDIGPVKLLIVTANLPLLQMDDDAPVPTGSLVTKRSPSSVELRVIGPMIKEAQQAAAVASPTFTPAVTQVPAPTSAPAGQPRPKTGGANVNIPPPPLAVASALPPPPPPPPGSPGAMDLEAPQFMGDLPHSPDAVEAAELFMAWEAREAENDALAAVLLEMGLLTETQVSAIRDKLRDYFLERMQLPADFGQLLVKNQLLTNEQLERALTRMRARVDYHDSGSHEVLPSVDQSAEAEQGRFEAVNKDFLEYCVGRGDLTVEHERTLKLGSEGGRVYLPQVALDYGMVPKTRLNELRQKQQIAAAQTSAQRLWKVMQASGISADQIKETVKEQIKRIKAGGTADLYEVLVEQGILSTGDVAQIRQKVADLPVAPNEITLQPLDFPELVDPFPALRAGNILGMLLLNRKQITPIQFATMRRLQDGLRLSGHRKSLFELIRAKGLIATEQAEAVETEYASLKARWEDEELADALVRLHIMSPAERDDLLKQSFEKRQQAVQAEEPYALQLRLGVMLHELGKVPRGAQAQRLQKANVVEDYLKHLGDDMRYPNERDTMAWAAQKYKVSNRRQIELSCAHQEFCLMLKVPLIQFLVDENVVPADAAEVYIRNTWFTNLRTYEEKLFALAVESGLIEKTLARKCLEHQAQEFAKHKRVVSAWVSWLKSRVEAPTRPVLPTAASGKPSSESGLRYRGVGDVLSVEHDPRSGGEPSSLTLTPVEVPKKAISEPAMAPSPANTKGNTGLRRRLETGKPQADVAGNPLLEPEAKTLRPRTGGVGMPLAPAVVVPAHATSAPSVSSTSAESVMNTWPTPETPRRALIEEWQTLKKQMNAVTGDQRERLHIREVELRLCVEPLSPADALALMAMHQRESEKFGAPPTPGASAAELEAKVKVLRRESDAQANWQALIETWLPAVFGPHDHARFTELVLADGFATQVISGTAITFLVYPPNVWLLPSNLAGFAGAPRIPMLGIDFRSCRVDMSKDSGVPSTLTIGFQAPEPTGGYRPKLGDPLDEVMLNAPAKIEERTAQAQFLNTAMAKLIDMRRRYTERVFREQIKLTLPLPTVHYYLGKLRKARPLEPDERLKQVRTLLLQLLKDTVFAIHPVEVKASNLAEFVKIASKMELVPNLAKMLVDSQTMVADKAAKELDQAVRMTLAALSPNDRHRMIYDPSSAVPDSPNPLPVSPWTGYATGPDHPLAAVMRYWAANPTKLK